MKDDNLTVRLHEKRVQAKPGDEKRVMRLLKKKNWYETNSCAAAVPAGMHLFCIYRAAVMSGCS